MAFTVFRFSQAGSNTQLPFDFLRDQIHKLREEDPQACQFLASCREFNEKAIDSFHLPFSSEEEAEQLLNRLQDMQLLDYDPVKGSFSLCSGVAGIIDGLRVSPDEQWSLGVRLNQAIDAGDLAKVKELLDRGADLETPSFLPVDEELRKPKYRSSFTPLLRAIYYGHRDMALLLMERGANIESASQIGWTALSIACRRDRRELVQELIDRGADLEHNTYGRTLLRIALNFKHAKVVWMLIGGGAKVDVQVRGGGTLLAKALKYKRWKVAAALVAGGAHFDFDWIQYVHLLLASQGEAWEESLSSILEESSAACLETLMPALCSAMATGWSREADYLLSQRVNLFALDSEGLSPLHAAVRSGSCPMVELLAGRGAPLNKISESGQTPLEMAIELGDAPVVCALLNLGASLDQENLLWTAIEKGWTEVVEYLLDKRVDLSALNSEGFAPLHVAACSGGRLMVEFLAGRGAPLEQRSEGGQTPLEMAIHLEKATVVHSLLTLGASVEGSDSNGEAPLHLAARVGNCKIVGLLLGKGASPTAENNSGQRPANIAEAERHTDTVELFNFFTQINDEVNP